METIFILKAFRKDENGNLFHQLVPFNYGLLNIINEYKHIRKNAGLIRWIDSFNNDDMSWQNIISCGYKADTPSDDRIKVAFNNKSDTFINYHYKSYSKIEGDVCVEDSRHNHMRSYVSHHMKIAEKCSTNDLITSFQRGMKEVMSVFINSWCATESKAMTEVMVELLQDPSFIVRRCTPSQRIAAPSICVNLMNTSRPLIIVDSIISSYNDYLSRKFPSGMSHNEIGKITKKFQESKISSNMFATIAYMQIRSMFEKRESGADVIWNMLLNDDFIFKLIDIPHSMWVPGVIDKVTESTLDGEPCVYLECMLRSVRKRYVIVKHECGLDRIINSHNDFNLTQTTSINKFNITAFLVDNSLKRVKLFHKCSKSDGSDNTNGITYVKHCNTIEGVRDLSDRLPYIFTQVFEQCVDLKLGRVTIPNGKFDVDQLYRTHPLLVHMKQLLSHSKVYQDVYDFLFTGKPLDSKVFDIYKVFMSGSEDIKQNSKQFFDCMMYNH